jgi:hypothetical protein
MNQKQRTRHGTIAVSFRVPPDLDELVNEVVTLERRKKRAIISLALEEYLGKYHAELLDKHKKMAAKDG